MATQQTDQRAGNWWTRMDPALQTAIIQGGSGILGGILAGMGQQGRDQALIEANREDRRSQDLLTMRGQDMDASARAAQLIGGSPLAFANQRQAMALKHALLGGNYQGGGVSAPGFLKGYTGKVSMPKFGPDVLRFSSPEAMANAEVPYWQAIAALNPDINPNLRAAGYGNTPGAEYASGMIDQSRLQNAVRQQLERQMLMGVIMGGGPGGPGYAAPDGYEWKYNNGRWELKKKGGGFWSKLGKGLGIIGGGIATALTGGAASPLLAAAIGAGSGALSGALGGGGWKGALLGAGLGGVTGGLGAGSGGAAGMGFGQAVKSAFTNPRLLTQAAGAAVGGPIGAGMQLGSLLLPTGFGNSPSYVRDTVNDVAQRVSAPNLPQPQAATPDLLQAIFGGQAPFTPPFTPPFNPNGFPRQLPIPRAPEISSRPLDPMPGIRDWMRPLPWPTLPDIPGRTPSPIPDPQGLQKPLDRALLAIIQSILQSAAAGGFNRTTY